MAKRGPKPQPVKAHVMAGTIRADRHGPPRAPAYLSPESRDLWKVLAEDFDMTPQLWDRALVVCIVNDDFWRAMDAED